MQQFASLSVKERNGCEDWKRELANMRSWQQELDESTRMHLLPLQALGASNAGLADKVPRLLAQIKDLPSCPAGGFQKKKGRPQT